MFSTTTVHEAGVFCDICKRQPIVGTRYKCLYCADYDLCTDCYESVRRQHSPSHIFARLDTPLGNRAWTGRLLTNPDASMQCPPPARFAELKRERVVDIFQLLLTGVSSTNVAFCPLTFVGCLTQVRRIQDATGRSMIDKIIDRADVLAEHPLTHSTLGIVRAKKPVADGQQAIYGQSAYEVIAAINAWSSSHIQEAILDTTQNIAAVGASVMLFDRRWKDSNLFDANGTCTKKFGPHLRVQKMHSKVFETLYERFPWGEGIQIDYAGDGATAILFKVTDTSITLDTIFSQINRRHAWTSGTCRVNIPRFKVRVNVDCANVLRKLNGDYLLSAASVADYVDDVYACKFQQKTEIDVNEQGTRIVSSTSMEYVLFAAPQKAEFTFDADRPFFFFVVDAFETIVVASFIVNPNE